MHSMGSRGRAEAQLRGLTARLFERRWIEAHGEWVEQHLRLLCSLRALLGNDLDKVIILAVIGQRMIRDALTKGEDNERVYDPDKLTNTESIAISTGLPRESVRRKILELGAAGWVRRDARGRLEVLPKAKEEMADTTQLVVGLVDHIVAGFVGMLVEDGLVDVSVPRTKLPSDAMIMRQ